MSQGGSNDFVSGFHTRPDLPAVGRHLKPGRGSISLAYCGKASKIPIFGPIALHSLIRPETRRKKQPGDLIDRRAVKKFLNYKLISSEPKCVAPFKPIGLIRPVPAQCALLRPPIAACLKHGPRSDGRVPWSHPFLRPLLSKFAVRASDPGRNDG